MKILLLGAGGMLGRELVEVLPKFGHILIATARKPLALGCESRLADISDQASLNDAITATNPDLVINTAAYTAVDKAESEPEEALRINAEGAKNIAEACSKNGLRLIHISTDYVYGGARPSTPVREGDAVSPAGVYGHSKYLGDEFVSSINGTRSIILRTSWLYGLHGANFVKTMLRLFNERSEIKVVDDQIGSPTWTGWLSEAIAKLIPKFQPGLLHAANHGAISWFEFATKIRDLSGSSCKVLPQTTLELGRPAPRPSYSALNCEKLEKLLGEPCQSWNEGLKEYLRNPYNEK